MDDTLGEVPARKGKVILGSLVGVLVLAATLVIGIVALRDSGDRARELDCSGMEPGGRFEFMIDGQRAELSIPAGEGFTFGSFSIRVSAVGYDSGPLERDGGLERMWIDDVNGDGRDDGVLVVRSGGSGGYVGVHVLESAPSGFALRVLPPFPASASVGYMGHDAVTVSGGVIGRSFPTYDDTGSVRVDRQWSLKEGLQGESPVKTGSDSNAAPSGSTRRLKFDYASLVWSEA